MKGLLKAEMLLPLAIVVAAITLGASELMKAFEFTPPGGDPLSDQLAGDRHGWAMLVLAIFALLSLAMSISTGQRARAWATAGCGIVALLLFLVVDLPDVNKIGDVEVPGGLGLASAKAIPQPGFWLEAAAAIVLALAGIAYATQVADKRRAPRRLWPPRSRAPRRPAPKQASR